MTQPSIEFTPRAFVTEVTEHTSVKVMRDWLAARGLPINRVGTVRQEQNGRFFMIVTNGECEFEPGDWIVVYAGELHIMDPERFRLFRDGSTRP